MTPLGRRIAEQITQDGPIPVAEFVRLCLTHPEYGYYRVHAAIGAHGDFITAPEISQVFGELVGLWAAEIWAAIGKPQSVRLVELGPGRGTMMADALRAVAKVVPEFRSAIDLHLVEVNPLLRERQEAALGDARPRWHRGLETIPDGPLLVLANEYFDIFPIRQFVRAVDGWRERVVTFENGTFAFAAGNAAEPPAELADAPPGSIVETSPEAELCMTTLAERIARHRGGALVIDYGPQARGIGDTLQAMRRQKKVDPLADPGLADLTAHVDFAGLAAAAQAAGARAHGPIPQGVFLHRLGIAARAATLLKSASPRQGGDISSAVARLIEPSQMGALFKALAVVDTAQPVPPGFDPAA
jgi:NADH dehydrogenase [ubiquinone] 1 alpha subcomplex assembly factor 7